MNTQTSFTIKPSPSETRIISFETNYFGLLHSFMTAAQQPSPPAKPRFRILKSALMLAGSMAFGGLAVVLWNRRELARMRNAAAEEAPRPAQPREDEIF